MSAFCPRVAAPLADSYPRCRIPRGRNARRSFLEIEKVSEKDRCPSERQLESDCVEFFAAQNAKGFMGRKAAAHVRAPATGRRKQGVPIFYLGIANRYAAREAGEEKNGRPEVKQLFHL